MDSGWTKGNDEDLSRPENAIQIRSKTILRRLTFGTVTRVEDPTETGFWFLHVRGTRVHFSGKW